MRGTSHWRLRARQAASDPRATLAALLGKAARSLSAAGERAATPQEAATHALEELALQRFYDAEVGRRYGLTRDAKEALVERFKRNTVEIPSGTHWLTHVVLAHEIVNTPPEVAGAVVECGAWKGASSASLSLVCKAVGRGLVICDSFEGLPEDEPQASHQYPHLKIYGHYRKGMYEGRLEEVKANIERCGDLSVCRFLPGFFSESLVGLRDPVAFAFLDVDLASSMRDCLKHIWPLLAEGSAVYTDDSCDMEVVRLWFDEQWWQRELGEHAPGYVGSGCGLPINPDYTPLGYARKLGAPNRSYGRVPWLYYPDASPEGPWFPAEERPS